MECSRWVGGGGGGRGDSTIFVLVHVAAYRGLNLMTSCKELCQRDSYLRSTEGQTSSLLRRDPEEWRPFCQNSFVLRDLCRGRDLQVVGTVLASVVVAFDDGGEDYAGALSVKTGHLH